MPAATQNPPRDRTRDFEAPPPEPPVSAAPSAPPARLPSWVSHVVDAAPLVLVVLVVAAILGRRAWRRLVLRGLFSLVAAGVVAGGTFYATYLAGCQAMQCVDVAGLVPMLAGLGVGVVAGMATLVVVWRRVGSQWPRT